MNESHVLELVSLPSGMDVQVDDGNGNYVSIINTQKFSIFTNSNPQDVEGIRLSYSDISSAKLIFSSNVASGAEDLSFKARAGIADGQFVETAATRYAYSRFVEYVYNIGIGSIAKNNLIIENTDGDIIAGDGNDIIVPLAGKSGSINGGNGDDILNLSSAVSAGGNAIIDLNQGTLYLGNASTATGNSPATVRDVSSIETIVGTSGDDTVVSNGSSSSSITIKGGAGDDYIVGGMASDILIGEQGDDIITGGDGVDKFIISVSDEDGKRDAGTDIITDFNSVDEILLAGFGLAKATDGSLPSEVVITKNATTNNYQVSVSKLSGSNTLSATIIIEDTGVLSGNEATAIQQITDAISFSDSLDLEASIPFVSDFEFPFEASVLDLMNSETSRNTFFGDDFAYDDIGDALGIIADAKFDTAYKTELGARSIDTIDLVNSTNTYKGISGSKNDDVLVAKDEDSVLFGGTGGSDRLIGGLGDDTLLATGSTKINTSDTDTTEDYLLGGAGSDNFTMINPSEINDTLAKIYQVRLEDFNRYEGDRVTLVGYDEHSIEISEVDTANVQTVQISNSAQDEILTLYFDLSLVRTFDSTFSLLNSDFDKVDSI